MAGVTRTRTRLAREERRALIVDAAAEVFRGRDPGEVTFEEIADAAGVSRALVYNYFGDRHGLLAAVHRRYVDVLQSRVTEAMAGATTVAGALRDAVAVHVELATTDPWGYRYAAGVVPFFGLADQREVRVETLARLYGGGPDGRLVAAGVLAAVQAMVLHWIDHPELSTERLHELVTALVGSGISSLHRHGVPLVPTWPAER